MVAKGKHISTVGAFEEEKLVVAGCMLQLDVVGMDDCNSKAFNLMNSLLRADKLLVGLQSEKLLIGTI